MTKNGQTLILVLFSFHVTALILASLPTSPSFSLVQFFNSYVWFTGQHQKWAMFSTVQNLNYRFKLTWSSDSGVSENMTISEHDVSGQEFLMLTLLLWNENRKDELNATLIHILRRYCSKIKSGRAVLVGTYSVTPDYNSWVSKQTKVLPAPKVKSVEWRGIL